MVNRQESGSKRSGQIEVLCLYFPGGTEENCDKPQDGRCPKVLLRIDPLLGNDSVNTFPLEPTRSIGRLLLGNGSVHTPNTIPDTRRRCYLWGLPGGYITGSSKGTVVESSFETPACRDMSSGPEELNWVESPEVVVGRIIKKWQRRK
jgi:hypothetical protein